MRELGDLPEYYRVVASIKRQLIKLIKEIYEEDRKERMTQ